MPPNQITEHNAGWSSRFRFAGFVFLPGGCEFRAFGENERIPDMSVEWKSDHTEPMSDNIKRELRVAFSKRCQPLLFRVFKWIFAVGGAVIFFRSSFFWYWVSGLLLIGLTVHFVYRWKTHAWTRPWGGWSDLEAGK